MTQIILTLIFYLFLALILALVFLMWRTSVRERHKLAQGLVDSALRSAEAAKESAEAVRLLAEKKEHPP